MTVKKIFFIPLVLLLLGACSSKEYAKQESAFIVFKTPVLKHADLGFIYEGNEGLKVELYSSGQAVMSLEITEALVCMGLFECMSKERFNKEVLSEAYPIDILDNIFRAKEIFAGQNKKIIRNGFTQTISKDNKYHINYNVLTNQVTFRDTINDIVIKIKRM